MTKKCETEKGSANVLNGFFISVIDKEGSMNRRYSDFVLAFLEKAMEQISDEEIRYQIERHDKKQCDTILQGLFIEMAKADFFVVLADSFISKRQVVYNPNVWFEFGVVSTLNRPVILIAREGTKIPFDTSDLKAIFLDNSLYNAITNCQDISRRYSEEDIEYVIDGWLGKRNTLPVAKKFYDDIKCRMTNMVKNMYSPFQSLYDHAVLRREIGYGGLIELLNQIRYGDSEFISGEENAFNALTEAVKEAKHTLFTTRFANQSIVTNPKFFHEQFTDALYDVSHKLRTCERIICNNAPAKWRDVFYTLVNSGNDMVVYVRATSFCTHFELVIIDDEIGFIHFYDKSMDESVADTKINPKNREFTESGMMIEEQVINSTLRLKGPVCKKLSSIFTRLHHKTKTIVSHTILGVDDLNDAEVDNSNNLIGIFQLKKFYGKTDEQLASKRYDVFEMLVNTYRNCCKKTENYNLNQNFNAEDAWNMYYGLKMIAEELKWPFNEIKPSIECPEKVKKILGIV